MKNSEIKDLTINELKDKISIETAALVKMKINHTVSPLENPMKIRESRRFIARLCSELRRRELNNEK